MATQNPRAGVPLTIRPESESQRVRLLELPAELLALVTSENPPRLHIKSKNVPPGANPKEAHSVLCTPDKTYQIRQVSTSNSVYLLRPHDIADPGPTEPGGITRAGVEAIAKCDTTIELLPTPVASALPHLKSTLPTYASTGNYGSGNMSKRDVFSHIPLSEAECEEAWRELACFESDDPAGCFIPSARVKAEIWQAAMTAAVADGIDVASPFPENEIPAYAIDLPGDWPREAVTGVFASVSRSTPGSHLAVDEQKAVRFAGVNLLQARSEGRPIEAMGFLKSWRDSVPEAWRSKCEFAVLQGYYSLEGNAKSIRFVDTSSEIKVAAETSTRDAKSLGAKRRWHERFKAAKKTA